MSMIAIDFGEDAFIQETLELTFSNIRLKYYAVDYFTIAIIVCSI